MPRDDGKTTGSNNSGTYHSGKLATILLFVVGAVVVCVCSLLCFFIHSLPYKITGRGLVGPVSLACRASLSAVVAPTPLLSTARDALPRLALFPFPVTVRGYDLLRTLRITPLQVFFQFF